MQIARTFKLLLAAGAVVFLPLGRQTEIDLETSATRTCATWCGLQITGYSRSSISAMIAWAQRDLGLRSKNQWAITTWGPVWFPIEVGTPPGNWLDLSTLRRCFLEAPDHEEAEVTALARQCMNTTERELRKKLVDQAIERWL